MTPATTGADRSGPRVQVDVDDLTEGVVLAEDINDQQGRLLMPAGTALTARHLRAFQLWGILSVRIRGEAAGPEADLRDPTPAEISVAEAEVRPRFRGDLAHPCTAELLRIVARRLAHHRLHGGGSDA